MNSLFNGPQSSAPAPANTTPVPAPTSTQAPAPVALLTEDEIRKAVPPHMRSSVTQGLVDLINNITGDPLIAENIRDNFIGYSKILQEGKFKVEDYVNAVTYVSYKMMGLSNQDAYFKTFPQRHANLTAQGKTAKDISAYVHAYHKGKLVNLIMEQTMVPTWVLNQDAFQRAINVQVELMTDPDVSAKVRSDAANSLLTHLKKPEAVKGQLSLDIGESSAMKDMRKMLEDLAEKQQSLIQQGALKTVDVAASKLIDRAGAEDV
jgi:hypothetical protein